MTKAFAEDFKRARELRKAIDVAEKPEEEQAAREAYREFRVELEDKGTAYNRFYRAYADAQNRSNACIDFSECIWEKEIPQLVTDLKAYGIEEFTLSSTWSGTVKVAWGFQKNGCILEGMEEISGTSRDFKTGDYEKVPAFKFRIS